jgi:hypothetical protein
VSVSVTATARVGSQTSTLARRWSLLRATGTKPLELAPPPARARGPLAAEEIRCAARFSSFC